MEASVALTLDVVNFGYPIPPGSIGKNRNSETLLLRNDLIYMDFDLAKDSEH